MKLKTLIIATHVVIVGCSTNDPENTVANDAVVSPNEFEISVEQPSIPTEEVGIVRGFGPDNLVDEVTNLIRGEWFEPLGNWVGLSDENNLVMSDYFLRPPMGPNATDGNVIACPNSGSATRSIFDPVFPNDLSRIIFDNCSGDDFIVNGVLTRTLNVYGSRWSSVVAIELEFDQFEFATPGEHRISIINGQLSQSSGLYGSGPICSSASGSSFEYDLTGLRIYEGDALVRTASGRYENNYRSGVVSDDVAGSQDANCYLYQRFDEVANQQAVFADLSELPTMIQAQVDISRGGVPTDTPLNSASINIMLNDQEVLSRSLISDLDRSAQEDIVSGGSATSEVINYDFFAAHN